MNRTLEEAKTSANEAEEALRQRRLELMTPAEAEYIWDELIMPKLLDIQPLVASCDSERSMEAAIRLMIHETTGNYLKEREERHDLGLPPLVHHDIDYRGQE